MKAVRPHVKWNQQSMMKPSAAAVREPRLRTDRDVVDVASITSQPSTPSHPD